MEVAGVPLKLRVTSHVRQLKVERNTSDPVHAGDVGNLHLVGLAIKPKSLAHTSKLRVTYLSYTPLIK